MEGHRYPISVGLIGVMHKEKCKMYMTSVLWSDENEIVVYRTFQDFKTMHKQLKKAFPPANKMKKSARIIPKFQDKMLNGGAKKKGPTKSLLRLKFLQKYCNKLLSCDEQVSQSADLIQFFHPKDQDLQPEFAKNCIMVLPSEDEVSADAGQVKGGNVTQPFVTETYRCVAPYETKDTKNKPFKVTVDEKVDVLIKDQAGWWLVENEDKRMAWFPAPYLESLDDADADEDYIDGSPERGELYTAVKSYKATKGDEITMSIGSVVEVLQKSDNGWWLIRYNNKAGYIPTMYLQPYNLPHIRMTAHHRNRRASSPTPTPTLELQSNQLSLSQGNLLQLPPIRSSSPNLQLPPIRPSSPNLQLPPIISSSPNLQLPPIRPSTPSPLQPRRQQRLTSLDILPEEPHFQPPAATSPTTAKYVPPPTIMLEMDGKQEKREMSPRADSEESFLSDSDFSDELNSSWASSSSFNLNLSQSYNGEQLRLSRTPSPMASNHLSPTSIPEGRMMPSISDPNLYKGPITPKVPPRPRAQDILTRCTTITRKNATKGSLSPTQIEIMSL
ncbi:NADPH oxidase organizer 1a [Anarrhichthys ocellatus]|uniref:NADPH oxidase organizer 1a n=1 Tax=Anarrhichthys ocellatus TaxID=433405 RepID=UPI0012ED8EC2|nr:NADPH oxidase organizer 1 [Anarrhichthys ocellatus]